VDIKVKTSVSIRGDDVLINHRPVYAEIDEGNPAARGLLFNARFIQGIFDDAAAPDRFARFGFPEWDPDAHTDRLIEALPEWHSYGLRAFTVGLQGGGPCFTMDNRTIDNNPFGDDGKALDAAYAARLDRLIRGADEAGTVAIVSFFYGDQAVRLRDDRAVREAVITASRFLREGGYTNVFIEIANEQNIEAFRVHHPVLHEPEGVVELMDLARRESGGMAVGCSCGGGHVDPKIAGASDIVLVHGNGQTRQQLYNLVRRAREYAREKPIICNEDSQAIGRLPVALFTHSSWGYYNNMTKQEPPTRWEVLPGEDRFFALRMAETVGIRKEKPAFEDQYHLQGAEEHMTYHGKRWIRLAALYPESVDHVDFHRNGRLSWTAWDEPFSVHFESTWLQGAVTVDPAGEEWTARVVLRDGRVVEKSARTPAQR